MELTHAVWESESHSEKKAKRVLFHGESLEKSKPDKSIDI